MNDRVRKARSDRAIHPLHGVVRRPPWTCGRPACWHWDREAAVACLRERQGRGQHVGE